MQNIQDFKENPLQPIHPITISDVLIHMEIKKIVIKHHAWDVVEDLPKSFVDLIQCSEADGRLYDLISSKSLCPLGSFKVITESQLSFIFRFVTTSVFPPPDRRDRTTNHICSLLSWTSSYGYITESKFLTRFDQVALELLFFYLNTVNVRWLSNDVQKYAAEKSHAATNNVVFFKAHIHYTFQHIKTIIDRSVHKN